MTEQEAWSDALSTLAQWYEELRHHNETILAEIQHKPKDFDDLIDGASITGKMEWVDEPAFKPEYDPDTYGVFTLTHVDQWSIGMEGDCFAGFLYVKVKGHDKWLKIPYQI